MAPQFHHKWDGLFRLHWDDISPKDSVSLVKVKAHRDIKSAVDKDDLTCILSNHAAYFVANKAITDHTAGFHGDKVVLMSKNIRKGTKAMLQALDNARTALGIPPQAW